MVNYNNLTLEEIEERIEKNSEILNKIWKEDDGNSWEKYKLKCQPYWDDNEALYAAKSLKTEPVMEPMSKLDEECRMPIEDFKECCEWGGFINCDGVGYYASENEVSNIEASPSAFVAGQIRTDFKYVCWYNK